MSADGRLGSRNASLICSDEAYKIQHAAAILLHNFHSVQRVSHKRFNTLLGVRPSFLVRHRQPWAFLIAGACGTLVIRLHEANDTCAVTQTLSPCIPSVHYSAAIIIPSNYNENILRVGMERWLSSMNINLLPSLIDTLIRHLFTRASMQVMFPTSDSKTGESKNKNKDQAMSSKSTAITVIAKLICLS